MSNPQPPDPWRAPDPLPNRLETDRLVIRYYESSDAEGMFEAVDRSRETLLPWLPWARDDDLDVAQCTFHIERSRRERAVDNPTNFLLAVFDKQTGAQVGGSGLHAVNTAWHSAEIGYWTDVARRGAGICTEATRAIIGWGLRPQADGGFGLRRVFIRCAAENVASRRVAEKAGMRPEGCHRRDRWLDGVGWVDTLYFGVLADEWSR